MKLAVILIRSIINTKPDVKKTLELLNLRRKNGCVIITDSESKRGMLQKIKDYATWGIINEETLKALQEKKGGEKKFYAMNPPKKGYGRKGIKTPFKMGGALGNRKDLINNLIKRMI